MFRELYTFLCSFCTVAGGIYDKLEFTVGSTEPQCTNQKIDMIGNDKKEKSKWCQQQKRIIGRDYVNNREKEGGYQQ